MENLKEWNLTYYRRRDYESMNYFKEMKNKVLNLKEEEKIEKTEEMFERVGKEFGLIDSKVFIDGDDIFRLPISEEEFSKALYFNSIVIRIDEDKEIMDSRIMIEAFIDTKPDYFAGHSMEVTITDDYKISVNRLAG